MTTVLAVAAPAGGVALVIAGADPVVCARRSSSCWPPLSR
jgi:hypothetical protein